MLIKKRHKKFVRFHTNYLSDIIFLWQWPFSPAVILSSVSLQLIQGWCQLELSEAIVTGHQILLHPSRVFIWKWLNIFYFALNCTCKLVITIFTNHVTMSHTSNFSLNCLISGRAVYPCTGKCLHVRAGSLCMAPVYQVLVIFVLQTTPGMNKSYEGVNITVAMASEKDFTDFQVG